MALRKCKECGEEISSSAKKCPKCGKDQRNFFMKHPVLYTILILIIIGIASNSGSDTTNTSVSTGTSGDTTASSTETIEYTAIDVDTLHDALEKNAAAAKETYNKQYLEITGKLTNIDSDLSYISIGSTTDDWDFMTISCYIKDDATKEVVKTLSTDETIVVKGQIKDVGEVFGYSLDIIEIVK